jgi:diaminohydroxyphosphoribosylaminopyrimidine deaminase / 5-amino-6-(5-phosphoribosylamino)uracil reductase
VALTQAGEKARGATVYVTLEPCCHEGKSGACTEALIKAGVAKVVVACRDPYPKVNGKGIARLREAGIEVEDLESGETTQPYNHSTTQPLTLPARELNKGFFSVVQRGRPWVTLKIATSADGYIADAHGHSKWITGEKAREHGHWLRSINDAVLTGMGTVLADDPLLTVRLAGREDRQPVRIVLEGARSLPKEARMLKEGGEVWRYQSSEFRVQGSVLVELLETLAQRGITRLMVEAGSRLSGAFWKEGLIDELHWYRSPKIFGSGLPAFGEIPLTEALVAQGERCETLYLGEDVLKVVRFSR